MRRLIIIFFMTGLSATGFAQGQGPSFIGIGGGLSLPMGNWGKSATVVDFTGYTNDPNGYAGLGGFSELDGAWFFSRHFGIGGLVSYGSYHFKDINELSSGYQQSFDVDTIRTKATNYKMWKFMPGLYFDLPFGKKLSFTARALAGMAQATTPQISVDVEDGGIDDGTFEQLSASKTAFAFDLGAGLTYRVYKCLGISLRTDFFYTKPDFVITNTLRNNAAGRYVPEYNEALAGINVSLGVSLFFGGK